MTGGQRRLGWGALVVAFWAGTSEVQAQTIGPFRWQFAPFCNTVTLTAELRGATYLLTGYDDQCGATVRAPASGTAHPNLDGTVGIGLTVVRPDGRAIHNIVSLSMATLSGMWTDGDGNGGTFIFNPPSPAAGPPRRITLRGSYAIQFQPTGAGLNGTDAISFGTLLATAPTAVTANFISETGLPTANCPGTATDPQAAPGHLCVYVQRLT